LADVEPLPLLDLLATKGIATQSASDPAKLSAMQGASPIAYLVATIGGPLGPHKPFLMIRDGAISLDSRSLWKEILPHVRLVVDGD